MRCPDGDAATPSRPAPAIRQAALCALLALVAAVSPACLETTFAPDPNADLGPVDTGDTGAIETAEDVAGTDAGDSANDAIDSSAGTDAEVTGQDADAAPEDESDANDAAPSDVSALLPFAATCTADGECDTGLCLAHGGGPKLCTSACDGDCPAGFRCGIDASSGSTLHYCLPLPGNLCKPCADDAQCPQGACLKDLGGAEPVCGLACDELAGGQAACPAGFVCQSFLKGELCVPANGTCSCSAAQVSQVWSCALQTPIGTCNGAQVCTDQGWSKCSAVLPTIEVCDGTDNNCDGKTDEGTTLQTPQGTLPLGAPCGTGACAGGKVVCASGGLGGACSSAVLAASIDLCGDKIDNDCDGKTDEECPQADTDGDKTADSKDCKPYDAKAFPGAKEPCCKLVPAADGASPIAVSDSTIACDLNCDLKVKACSTKDADGDGFEAPGDCNDKDATVMPGGKEKCDDGVDQDCDGSDMTCTGLTDADKDGYPLGVDCNDDAATIHPLAVENCNFIDDDCDGIIDEENPGGVCSVAAAKTEGDCSAQQGVWTVAGSACGSSIGACKPGILACKHVGLAVSVTCVDASVGSIEACNGQDDDCNGETDEAYPDIGKSCDGDDTDACQFGKRICAADGKDTVCGIETKSDLLETCDAQNPAKGNGKDEDCDGQTDEVCWSSDVDGDGVQAPADCNDADAGVFPGASAEPCCDPAYAGGPAALELCDRNCDGKVSFCDPGDKDFDGKTGGDDCDETDPLRYLGAIEKCGDSIDQDCNGADLKCSDIGDGDGDGYATAIDCNDSNAAIYPNAFEKCNLKDDDCDGLTDEGNPEAAPTSCGLNQGICKPGKEVCVRQLTKATVLCVPEKGPQPELCNGVDDNCNGKSDEYFPTLAQACDGSDLDLCSTGTATCKADGSDVECVNEQAADLVELCNGADDDCDGQTDEGMSYFGKAVGADCDGQGSCGAGTVVCSPELAVAVCSTDLYGPASQAKPEICNSQDDDCDGLTDEGMLFAGVAVGGVCKGTGGCAGKTGKVECGPDGAPICSTMPGGSAYAGSKEVCNNIDDDCDGRVNEGLSLADSTCKVAGVCTPQSVTALCIAGAWKCGYSAVAGYQGDTEVFCDGVDNDCDGKTDDEFSVGKACDGDDSDKCTNGLVSCSPDKLFSVCSAESPSGLIDVCNDKDDDCDGHTDEDFPIGKACDGKDDDKCPTGTFTCAADATTAECINEPPVDKSELCNGKDDDCDGLTDEGFGLGEACDGSDADQCKNGVFVCSADGKGPACPSETIEAIKELCDAADNDCDGQTDEGQLYSGASLGKKCTGIGSCGPGNVVCSPGTKKATCSTNPDAFLIFDGKELCDGLDNDCNGLTDDDLAWKGHALGATCPGQGTCGAGKVQCGKDKQVTCSTLGNGTQAQAKAELCDGLDNDCNGQTDDGLGLAQSPCSAKGVCTPEATVATCGGGQWQCDYSGIKAFQQSEVTCDGLDNDCDGLTDEGFDTGLPCDGDDKDQCKNGTWACSAAGKAKVCENESMTSIPEVCDGKDNDCDGATDENFTYNDVVLGAPCDGSGECGAGEVVCGAVSLVAVCSTDPDGTASQAKAEICDNKDNDCDAVTDDGMKFQGLPKGLPCTGVGECGLGVVECNPIKKVPVCSSNLDGTESKSIFEQCNGKDDDCDGQSDEDVDITSTTCNKQGACEKALVTTCKVGKWQCVFSGAGYQSKESFCDNIDNDCDGVTDNGFSQKGAACDGSDADTCKNGKLECAPDKASLLCGVEAPVSTVEICDTLDNDCNGQTDEAFPTLGQPCDSGDSDLCKNGVLVCAAAQKSVTCGPEFPTDVKEICDGADNDCDGLTDEGFDVGAACDGPDSDQCKLGKLECDKQGKSVCGTESPVSTQEICNGIDDDCDSQTDEGFEQKGQKCKATTGSDDCATGTLSCGTNGALVCANDVECAIGASCKKSTGATTPDACLCGTAACSATQGDECNLSTKVCTCNAAPACGSGKTCIENKGCQ